MRKRRQTGVVELETNLTYQCGRKNRVKSYCPAIPEDKISVLLASIREVSSSRVVTARMLAQVTWRIISCMLIFGNICKIMTKALHSVIDSRAYWNARVCLTAEAISELNYWCANARAINSRPFVYPVKVYQEPECT